MKTKTKLLSVLLIAGLLTFTGCLTKTPVYSPLPDGGRTTNFVFGVPPAATNAAAISETAAPFLPSPYGDLLKLLTGGVAAGLGMYAKYRNDRQALTKEHAINSAVTTALQNTPATATAGAVYLAIATEAQKLNVSEHPVAKAAYSASP